MRENSAPRVDAAGNFPRPVGDVRDPQAPESPSDESPHLARPGPARLPVTLLSFRALIDIFAAAIPCIARSTGAHVSAGDARSLAGPSESPSVGSGVGREGDLPGPARLMNCGIREIATARWRRPVTTDGRTGDRKSKFDPHGKQTP